MVHVTHLRALVGCFLKDFFHLSKQLIGITKTTEARFIEKEHSFSVNTTDLSLRLMKFNKMVKKSDWEAQ